MRQEHDIDMLWNFFSAAIDYADNAKELSSEKLKNLFDKVKTIYGVNWNRTMGLYWIRPWKFLTLDGVSRNYIKRHLKLDVSDAAQFNSDEYFNLIKTLNIKFQKDTYPVHSFPDLSYTALNETDLTDEDNLFDDTEDAEDSVEESLTHDTLFEHEIYTIEQILNDGCFLKENQLQDMVQQLKDKKNLILQGPPGTGKTWLAKKLAFAVMGKKNIKALHAMQFHANVSYEDFIRGWRPAGDGKLTLVDGPFLRMITQAKADKYNKSVMVIEEINRGNPAQIFSEMLTLLEADKHCENEALELSYSASYGEKVFIPDNLYVIGTMNLADRSLALFDLALRRRFAFFDLTPQFNDEWQKWIKEKAGITEKFSNDIKKRIEVLNNKISSDPNLGKQFEIGHSYFTTHKKVEKPHDWYKSIIETQIIPLLKEYWFNDSQSVTETREALLKGI